MPKLTDINLRFPNFPEGETPGPTLKGGRGSGGEGMRGKGKSGLRRGREWGGVG